MKRVAILVGVVLLLAACGGGGTSDADQIKHPALADLGVLDAELVLPLGEIG